VGTLFERGLGVGADAKRARVWYQRAAKQGNVKAMHNLAVLSAGSESGSPDYAAAAQWFTEAAEHGLADSQYNLGIFYENGLGVAKDAIVAFKWYALAARSGDKDAIQRRDLLKSEFSVEDLERAEGLVEGFVAKQANTLVNDARTAGEDWKSRQASEGSG
jgi:localization factor PodJL